MDAINALGSISSVYEQSFVVREGNGALSLQQDAGSEVSISTEAKGLQTMISGLSYDAELHPGVVPEYCPFTPFTDLESLKATIKEDFNRIGVYVDDAYVSAFAECVLDPYSASGPGPIPPNMPLPTPPDWWTGYRPMA